MGRGGRVIELVGEIGGKLAERGELFCLELHAGELADSVQQDGDATLAHGGDGGQQLGEAGFGDVDGPDGANGVAVAAVALHPREGQFAGELAGAADEDGDRPGVAAAHLDVAMKDDVQVDGGLILLEQQRTVFADALTAVGGDPGVLLVGKAVELAHGAQGGDDLRDGSGVLGGAGAIQRRGLVRLLQVELWSGGSHGEPPTMLVHEQAYGASEFVVPYPGCAFPAGDWAWRRWCQRAAEPGQGCGSGAFPRRLCRPGRQ